MISINTKATAVWGRSGLLDIRVGLRTYTVNIVSSHRARSTSLRRCGTNIKHFTGILVRRLVPLVAGQVFLR